MAIEYTKDDASRTITMVVRGPLQLVDAISALDRQAAERAWTYGTVCDARGLTEAPTTNDLQQIIAFTGRRATELGRRGPVAVVASGFIGIQFALAYEHLRAAPLDTRLFASIDGAQAWLATAGSDAGRPLRNNPEYRYGVDRRVVIVSSVRRATDDEARAMYTAIQADPEVPEGARLMVDARAIPRLTPDFIRARMNLVHAILGRKVAPVVAIVPSPASRAAVARHVASEFAPGTGFRVGVFSSHIDARAWLESQ